MGKPQGDYLTEPTYYVREIDGEVVTRPAYTPADHVNLKAAGWVEQQQQAAVTDARRGGSPQRERAQVVPTAPAAPAGADGRANA